MRFTAKDHELAIELEGLEQLWALKRRLDIPDKSIEVVAYIAHEPRLQDFQGHLLQAGVSLPWRFLAGTHKRKGRREFWYVHTTQPGLLVITLRPGAFDYSAIRVSCRPEIAQGITEWWHRHKTRL